MLYTTQCTQVPCGASGSSQINAKVFVPAGLSDHSRGGEISRLSQVYLAGIVSPSLNAELLIYIFFPPSYLKVKFLLLVVGFLIR